MNLNLPVFHWAYIDGEPLVYFDSCDAEVTANLLAFLTSTYIDWSAISNIFRDSVIHALQLRALRLTALYNEKYAQVRMENPQSKDHTLQEDTVALGNILAKFEPACQTLLGVFHRHLTLSEELPSLPEEVSFMTCMPIMVRWNIPSSLSPLERMKCRGEWNYFQSCMEDCRTQIKQSPVTLETLEMLERIPEHIKDKSPVVLQHPGVQDWLNGVHRLAEGIRSRNGRKAEVQVTIKKLRDYDRRSREAFKQIKGILAELFRCNYQVGIVRAHSEARYKAFSIRNQQLREHRDSLLRDLHDLNVEIARGESDMAQEYKFGVEKCVAPWTFPQAVSLLAPVVLYLVSFMQQEYGSDNLEALLYERVDGDISLLSGMACNSRAVEDSTLVTGRSEACENSQSRLQRVSSDTQKKIDTRAADGSKEQRCD